jgi:hypothetical protein
MLTLTIAGLDPKQVQDLAEFVDRLLDGCPHDPGALQWHQQRESDAKARIQELELQLQRAQERANNSRKQCEVEAIRADFAEKEVLHLRDRIDRLTSRDHASRQAVEQGADQAAPAEGGAVGRVCPGPGTPEGDAPLHAGGDPGPAVPGVSPDPDRT